MTAVAARTLSARRRGRRLARPVRQVRRPPAGARRTKRRWRLVLLAAAGGLEVGLPGPPPQAVDGLVLGCAWCRMRGHGCGLILALAPLIGRHARVLICQ